MMTQEEIDRREALEQTKGRIRNLLSRVLTRRPKEPKLVRAEWLIVIDALRLVAEDNIEVIGSFGNTEADRQLDLQLEETAERFLALANKIEEMLR